MQIIDKNSGPRTTCFLDPGATSALEIGDEKGDQTKDWPKLAYHYFSRANCWYARFWFERKSGTHNSGAENIVIFEASQNRGLKNDYFFNPRVVRTTIFLEPETCVPLFL